MADEQASQDGISRRRFLSVVGVTSAGAAALSGCSTDKVEKLIPYLVQSEDQVPGIPTIYASTCTECSAGCGLHVITREGRAVKLEGNPEHPVNKGRLCARGQAGLQERDVVAVQRHAECPHRGLVEPGEDGVAHARGRGRAARGL